MADESDTIIKTAIDAIGAENVYYFTYDWTADPFEVAEQLDAYIEMVKEEENGINFSLFQ